MSVATDEKMSMFKVFIQRNYNCMQLQLSFRMYVDQVSSQYTWNSA
jgi:hypothetical protein